MRTEQVKSAFEDPSAYLKRRYRVRWRVDAVAAFLADRRFESCADFGCGDGSLSVPFLGRIGHLTLVDTSQAMLDAARKSVASADLPRVEFFNGDADNVALAPGSLDLALCVGLLAHITSPEAILARLTTFLKPGGLLILEHTDAQHPAGWLLIQYSRLRSQVSPAHYPWNAVGATTLLSTCEKLGLELQAEYRFGLPFRLDRIVADEPLYHLGKFIFGGANHNTNGWLGCERMYCMVKR